MTLTHALPIGNYGVSKFIVATSAANGTHTTLASALAAASAGDTVFLRDSVTENVTIPAGVNIAGWEGGTLNTPSITGTVTMTAAGTCNIRGVRLVTNSAAAIAVTGSAASILNIFNCYLDFTNNTGITFSSSSSSAQINVNNCQGNLGTTGIGIYAHTSAGSLSFNFTNFTNSGGSSTASTLTTGQAGFNYSGIFSPLSASSGTLVFNGGFINTIAQNATCITLTGTAQCASHVSTSFASGSASALSIGSGTTFNNYSIMEIYSTNTNAITGAGAIGYGPIIYSGSSSTNNVTTQTPFPSQIASTVAYAPICGGTTDKGVLQSVASAGTSGQVLTSNGPSALPTFQTPAGGGVVVQQVRQRLTTKTQYTSIPSIPRDTSIPQNTEGTEMISQAITPTNASNILWIQLNMTGAVDSTTNNNLEIALFQDSTANALETQTYDLRSVSQEGCVYFYFSHFMVAGTTSSTTFKFRLGGQALGTITVNGVNNTAYYGGTMGTILTITELTP